MLAVFRQEGLSGRVGDGGHAFGPAQVNDAGGVLTGKLPGQTPEQKQAWAWSPQGIEFALSGVSKVAAGKKGPAAVDSIVTKFERPADPRSELSRALASYQPGAAGGGLPLNSPVSRNQTVAPQSGPMPNPGPSPFIQALLQQTADTLGVQPLRLPAFAAPSPASTPAVAQRAAAPRMATSPGATAGTPSSGGTLAELLHEGVGGPTHSTGEHIHVASRDPQTNLGVIALAQKLGLAVRENPYVDPVDPVHAPHSFHKVTFPGLYNGRKLGEAEDVSGGPQPLLQKFYSLVQQRYGR